MQDMVYFCIFCYNKKMGVEKHMMNKKKLCIIIVIAIIVTGLAVTFAVLSKSGKHKENVNEENRDDQINAFFGSSSVTNISQLSTPSITTIKQPCSQLGYLASELLIEKINNPDTEIKQVQLPTELIIRESTSQE